MSVRRWRRRDPETGEARDCFMPDGGDGIPIHGLAVCQYATGKVYRFSCDRGWEVNNDFD
jgi:hypothetical protein